MNTDRRGFLGLTIGALVGARLVAPEIARAAKPRVGSSTAAPLPLSYDQALDKALREYKGFYDQTHTHPNYVWVSETAYDAAYDRFRYLSHSLPLLTSPR